MDIQIKQVYEPADPQDGSRVLVDRLWPRGFTKERVAGLWLKDAAPSSDLRSWFSHDRSKWEEFKRRYYQELEAKPQVIAMLLDEAAQGRLTLLYAARDQEINQAVALREYLLAHSRND